MLILRHCLEPAEAEGFGKAPQHTAVGEAQATVAHGDFSKDQLFEASL